MKTKRLSLRITTEEQDALHQRAKKAGVKLTTFVVEMCAEGSIKERRPLDEDERKFYGLLTQYSNNWRALSNLFARRQDEELAQGLKDMIKLFAHYRKKFLDR